MTTVDAYFPSNSFSWRRLAMLGHLYQPALKWSFAICALLPCLLYLLAAFVGQSAPAFLLPYILWPARILIYLMPVTLAMRNYRGVSSQLPVTAGEKLAFLVLTFWIAVPVLIYLSGLLGNWLGIAATHTSVNELIREFQESSTSQLPVSATNIMSDAWWINSISFVATSTIVIYYVVVPRHNRVLYCVLSYFVTTVVTGIVAGIAASAYTFYRVVVDDVTVISLVVEVVKLSVVAVLITLVIAGAIYFVKLYKHLRNNGL